MTHRRLPELKTERKLVASATRELGLRSLKLELRHDAGWQDRLWILDRGRTFWMELKAPGERVEPGSLQAYRADFLRGLGHDVAWFDDYDAAWAALKERVKC